MTMQDGFLRAAAASIPVAVADPRRNAAAVCARIDQAHRARAALLVLPELCVTGYTCGDLFLSALLLDAAEEALLNICAHTQNCDPVVVLGVPLRAGGKLYNCAAVLHRGRILGVVPKTWLPNYDVFAEKRCFASAAAYHGPGSVPVSGADVPFGTGLVFACAQMPAFRLGVELCEDVWAPIPPSVRLCLAGATVIANCSASPEAAGKPARRRTLLRAAINRPRPYEALNFTPLFPKDTKGQSMPSRHCFSAAAIVAAAFTVWVPLGVAACLLAAVVAVTRVLTGVHYPSDVLAGLAFGAGAAVIGFLL
jgi:predicted amidohydrolase